MTTYRILVPEIHYIERKISTEGSVEDALERLKEYHKNMISPTTFWKTVDPGEMPWKVQMGAHEVPYELVWNPKERQYKWVVWGTAKRGYGY